MESWPDVLVGSWSMLSAKKTLDPGLRRDDSFRGRQLLNCHPGETALACNPARALQGGIQCLLFRQNK